MPTRPLSDKPIFSIITEGLRVKCIPEGNNMFRLVLCNNGDPVVPRVERRCAGRDEAVKQATEMRDNAYRSRIEQSMEVFWV